MEGKVVFREKLWNRRKEAYQRLYRSLDGKDFSRFWGLGGRLEGVGGAYWGLELNLVQNGTKHGCSMLFLDETRDEIFRRKKESLGPIINNDQIDRWSLKSKVQYFNLTSR